MKHSFNLFILEDDPSERQLLALLIQKYFPDWNLRIFSTGEQLLNGLVQSCDTPVSLVLVDMQLCGSDGMSVLTQIHTLQGSGNLPVVGFSNYSSRVDIEAFLKAGAVAFFTKPVDIDLLVEWLARLPLLSSRFLYY